MSQGPRFCPKCGTLMRPRLINGRLYLECPNCGYREEAKGQTASATSLRQKVVHTPREKIVVVDANAPPPTAQVLKGSVRCPRCGNDEVLAWMMQTRAADEPPTRFYRCTKCGYTWREYA